MIPEGWARKRADKVLDRVSRPVDVTPDQQYQQIGIRSHGKGLFDKEHVSGTELGDKRVFWVEPECFIVNIVFAWEQAVGVTSNADIGKIASHRFPMFRPKPDQCDIRFIDYFFKTPQGKFLLGLASPGGAGRNKTLGQKEFDRLELTLPPLPEQQKIVEILGTWDKAIETTEALLANARTQKRALMQSLLTGTRRFPGFEDHPWREVRLNQLVDVNPSLNVCPIDGNLTFLPMEAVSEEAEIVAPRSGSYFTDLKGFTAFKDGDVLVAKITPCFENGKGCHARNLVNGVGTGSTEFHVLRPKIETDVRFIFHLVNSHPFRERGRLNMQGSAGQQRVPSDYIRLFRWTVPSSPKERETIGAAIDGATVEVEHMKRQLDHLRTEKKSLMQQLLTGKRRVVV